jgi:hypothetical protein
MANDFTLQTACLIMLLLERRNRLWPAPALQIRLPKAIQTETFGVNV